VTDDPFVQWESRNELIDRITGKRASVQKYRIRKSAALVIRDGTVGTPVAYFTSAEAARRFCDEFLGGVIGPHAATKEDDRAD
jgi:hypothetical protein